MIDPPTYRAEPDQEFADCLERLLLQRLTADPRALRSSGRVALSDGPVHADTDLDDHEGDIMLETEDRPMGHEPPSTGRGSPRRWLLAGAAAAVVAVVGTLIVTAGDDDRVDTADPTPATTAATQDTTGAAVQKMEDLPEGMSELPPGRYSIDPDGDDATPLRVSFQVSAEGWTPWLGAYKFRDDALSSFSITTVTNLVTNGCTAHFPLDPAVGPSVDDLATALAQLPPFEVAAAPTDVTLFGYSGKHLELAVPDLRSTGVGDNRRYAACVNGELRSWVSPLLGGSFWGYSGIADLSEEFWILDVDGTRLVLVQLDSPNAPAQDIAERDAMFDSIRIEP
jgi:hypothetical protein